MNASSTVNGRQYLVRELEDGDESRWDSFVERCEEGTFYHLSGWKHIIERSLRHRSCYLLCECDGAVVAVLPLAQVRSLLFGNTLISLPFLVYGGPVATDPVGERLLVERAREVAWEMRVDCLELRCRKESSRDWPEKHGYATFSKTIDPEPEKNLLAIPRKQRAMIRKGIKAGLRVELDEDATRLYTALLECKRNLGTPFFARHYLQDICDTFREKAEILTITKDGKTICSVMSFRFRDQILPYYGGGGSAARLYNGNDFMYWAVMEKACRDGVNVFDYGRSMVGSGAYRFKKHWGFEPTALHYEYLPIHRNEVPNLNPANPRFRLMIETWKRLPLSVAGRLGPPIARLLG